MHVHDCAARLARRTVGADVLWRSVPLGAPFPPGSKIVTNPRDPLDITVPRSLSHWSSVQEAITTHSQIQRWNEAVQHQVLFMVEELVVNTMTHGCPQAGLPLEQAWVRVECWEEDHWIRIRITDNLMPFDPRQAPAPDLDASLEDRPIGGLGVHLTLTMADSFTYERRDGCNVTTLGKRRGAQP